MNYNINLKDVKEGKKCPIWMMRQAGRYMDEYKIVRKREGNFINMCKNPEIVKEVTLQPIKKFGMDMAIIFSDILLICEKMDYELKFLENKGPIISYKKNLKCNNIQGTLEGIKLVSSELNNKKPLIGFAGGPLTVLSYILEGGSSSKYSKFYNKLGKEDFDNSMKILEKYTIDYLCEQIQNGVNIIKIFESNSGILSCNDFNKYVIEVHCNIINKIRFKYPDVPIIGFPRNAGVKYLDYVRKTGVDVIAIDYTVPLIWARDNLQEYSIIQGNLDPHILAFRIKDALKESEQILKTLLPGGLIFNLGHGIIPCTPVENVKKIVDFIKACNYN